MQAEVVKGDSSNMSEIMMTCFQHLQVLLLIVRRQLNSVFCISCHQNYVLAWQYSSYTPTSMANLSILRHQTLAYVLTLSVCMNHTVLVFTSMC
jgi:hypothetical protein